MGACCRAGAAVGELKLKAPPPRPEGAMAEPERVLPIERVALSDSSELLIPPSGLAPASDEAPRPPPGKDGAAPNVWGCEMIMDWPIGLAPRSDSPAEGFINPAMPPALPSPSMRLNSAMRPAAALPWVYC